MSPRQPGIQRHARWVRISHTVAGISILILMFSGVEILMVHPRLYWGETGNDLTPALLELPISRNHQHQGWTASAAFFSTTASPVSAGRTYDIFNQNSWGRSLHFLAAWFLVVIGLTYLLMGIFQSHFRRHFLPGPQEWKAGNFRRDLAEHIKLMKPRFSGGPDYGFLQKVTYAGVVFLALPLMVVTGFSMAPTLTATFPFLLDMWGGFQSARTIHFFTTIALIVFLTIHLFMVIRSGFKKQVLAITIGHPYEAETHHHEA